MIYPSRSHEVRRIIYSVARFVVARWEKKALNDCVLSGELYYNHTLNTLFI